jgi:hypothetical protein
MFLLPSIGPRDPAEQDDEPGTLPVEPDEGPVSPALPQDPEHDRMVDPEV